MGRARATPKNWGDLPAHGTAPSGFEFRLYREPGEGYFTLAWVNDAGDIQALRIRPTDGQTALDVLQRGLKLADRQEGPGAPPAVTPSEV